MVPGMKWSLASQNPVLRVDPRSPWIDEAVYDCCALRQTDGTLWLYYSTRGTSPPSIALARDAAGTGNQWQPLAGAPLVQPTPQESRPCIGVTRPSVVRLPGGGYRLWYSTADSDHTAWIGTAASPDGLHWTKHGAPVLEAQLPWEKQAVQCPNCIYDAESLLYKLWYSAGDVYEPDAVGYATSPDGVRWQRASGNPVFTPTTGWEDYKVGSFQVIRLGDWYYAFYNAFQRTPFRSQVGMARSRDGIGGWERHPLNPILRPGAPGHWDAAMVYKPAALWDARRGRWDVWFNASSVLNQAEQIGHAWSTGVW